MHIKNITESKTEATHSDKKLMKPEKTVTTNTDRFALSDTTFSSVDQFTVYHQQLYKQTMIGGSRLGLSTRKINIKLIFPGNT